MLLRMRFGKTLTGCIWRMMPLRESLKNMVRNVWHSSLPIPCSMTEPESVLNGQSRAGIEETVLCYAQAQIDEMGLAEEVELLLNGRSLGKQTVSGTFIAAYEVPYQPGRLEAVSYLAGKEAGRCVLETAGKPARLKVETESRELPADGESLAFVKIRLADAEGNWNRQQEVAVTVKAEGGVVLQGFGSANPSCKGSYQESTWNTYDGTVMAVVRAAKEPGQGRILVSAQGCDEEVLVFRFL